MALAKLNECAAAVASKQSATYGYDAVRGGARAPIPFQQSLANYFSKALRVPIDGSRIVASAGCTPVIENTVFGLLDPGDGLLVRTLFSCTRVPLRSAFHCFTYARCFAVTVRHRKADPRRSRAGGRRLHVQVQQPLYPGFLPDLGARGGISCQTVPRTPNAEPHISLSAVQLALDAAQRRGVETKAMLLTSPCNPTGRLHDPAALREIVSFLADNDIDMICDEIYAGSVFDESRVPFASTLSVAEELGATEKVHVVTGLSKDFPFASLRVGCVISKHTELLSVMRAMARFSAVSAHTMRCALRLAPLPGGAQQLCLQTTAARAWCPIARCSFSLRAACSVLSPLLSDNDFLDDYMVRCVSDSELGHRPPHDFSILLVPPF
eukprot:SAG31_NODE_4790_length_2954_cov_22.392995_2_plen_381_part_00